MLEKLKSAARNVWRWIRRQKGAQGPPPAPSQALGKMKAAGPPGRREIRARIRRARRLGIMGANGLVFRQPVMVVDKPAGRYGRSEVWPWGPKVAPLLWPWGPRGLRLGLRYHHS